MDVPTITVLLCIGAAAIGLLVLLERRDRQSRHIVPPAGGYGEDESLRERARAQHDGEASRGQAAGLAYDSGIGGNAP